MKKKAKPNRKQNAKPKKLKDTLILIIAPIVLFLLVWLFDRIIRRI